MFEFDPGPPQPLAQAFADCPDYGDLKSKRCLKALLTPADA